MQSFAHRGIFRTKPDIYDEALFTSAKSYFKNVLNLIEWPLVSNFYTAHPFVKKLTTLKTSGLFFSKFESMQSNDVINKEVFIN